MPRINPKPVKEYPWYVRLLFWFQKKKYGQVLESSKIWARSPFLFLGLSALYGAFDRKSSPLEPTLKTLLIVWVSQMNHCEFCIDLNTARYFKQEGDENKLNALNTYQQSLLFSEREKAALAYAEAITHSDQEVSDSLFDRVKSHFNEDEIIEITGLIAFQNCSTKFNNALKISSQDFLSTRKPQEYPL